MWCEKTDLPTFFVQSGAICYRGFKPLKDKWFAWINNVKMVIYEWIQHHTNECIFPRNKTNQRDGSLFVVYTSFSPCANQLGQKWFLFFNVIIIQVFFVCRLFAVDIKHSRKCIYVVVSMFSCVKGWREVHVHLTLSGLI